MSKHIYDKINNSTMLLSRLPNTKKFTCALQFSTLNLQKCFPLTFNFTNTSLETHRIIYDHLQTIHAEIIFDSKRKQHNIKRELKTINSRFKYSDHINKSLLLHKENFELQNNIIQLSITSKIIHKLLAKYPDTHKLSFSNPDMIKLEAIMIYFQTTLNNTHEKLFHVPI